MNRKALIPSVALGVAVMVMFSVAAFSGGWFKDYNAEELHEQKYAPEADGTLHEDSINYQLFERYGPVLLVLAILMFGAIIGGVYIAKEDEDNDSD
jgi:NADH:ubiquinone oxidoreductase subunit 6 (subunit J)